MNLVLKLWPTIRYDNRRASLAKVSSINDVASNVEEGDTKLLLLGKECIRLALKPPQALRSCKGCSRKMGVYIPLRRFSILSLKNGAFTKGDLIGLKISQLLAFRGHSRTTFANFWPFLTPTPWLTAPLNRICTIYLVELTLYELPSPINLNLVCEWTLTLSSIRITFQMSCFLQLLRVRRC